MPVPVLQLPRGSAIEPLHSALVVPHLLSEETNPRPPRRREQAWGSRLETKKGSVRPQSQIAHLHVPVQLASGPLPGEYV